MRLKGLKLGADAEFEKWKNDKQQAGKKCVIKLVLWFFNFLQFGRYDICSAFWFFFSVKEIREGCNVKQDSEVFAAILALVRFHVLGPKIRFEWNKKWKDEDYALAIELKYKFEPKEIYNPCGLHK